MSASLMAQKLPFQGQLIQDGAPFTGPVEITFSIPDGVGGELWSEIQPVEVVDGLYSVVLGNVNPLPGDLFDAAGERQLNISVNATALSPVTIYAGLQRSKFSKTMTGTADSPAVHAEINGAASNMAAIEGYAATEGDNYGVYGQGQGIGGKYNIGMYGVGLGAGNGELNNWEVQPNTFGSYNYGMYGVGRDNLNGNIGVYGYALGSTGTDNIGVVGWSEVGAGAENKGVVGWAKGTGINKGVIGLATGGSENWAGWFEGDVKITGSLVMDGSVSDGGSEFFKAQDSEGSEEINGLKGIVSGTGVWAPGEGGAGITQYSGLFGVGNALNGGNAGVRGFANIVSSSTGFNYGVYGIANASEPNSVAVGYGLRGEASGSMHLGVAVRGIASNTNPAGIGNIGGDFSATSNPTENLGLRGNAFGESGRNIGVKGSASGGLENWAGWFDGDVQVNGNLNLSSPSIGMGEKSWEDGTQGFVHLYGDTPEGKDNIRAGLEVNTNGTDTWGALNLSGPVFTDPNCVNCPRGFVGLDVSNDPNGGAPTEWSGILNLNGHESPNVIISGQNYADSDLGEIRVFGNQPDGNNWWYSHASLSVGSENGQQFGQLSLSGNDGKENVTIGAKGWETNGGGRPFLRMKGNTPDVDLIWMEVYENEGTESGSLSIRNSADGQSTSISHNQINVSEYFDGTGVWIDGEVGNIDATGNISSPNITSLSDRRLKENITPLQNSLSNTLKLRGVSYNWLDKSKTQKAQIGVIAQEVEEVYPEFVHTNSEGMKSVNYSQMVAVLIEAIKELNTQIESLKSENASLKTELAKATDNEKRISELEASMKTLIGLVQQQDKPAAESNIEIGRQE